MSSKIGLRSLLLCAASLLLFPIEAVEAQSVTLTAPERIGVGAALEIHWSGADNPRDFITVVPRGTEEGRYTAYAYARQSPVALVAPTSPGDFEIRYLGATAPYPTLARKAIAVHAVEAELTAPDRVASGAAFSFAWEGPDNPRDFITLVPAGTPEGKYEVYVYTNRGNPATLTAPDAVGDYELRYLLGAAPYPTLASRPISLGATTAALHAPKRVDAGTKVEIAWEGPDNRKDFITIVPAGTPERDYDDYVYTDRGNPAMLTAPESPGEYEVRYLTGQTYATLATAPLSVGAVSATLDAPATAPARDVVTVRWRGPGNPQDFVILLPVGSDNDAKGPYAYVARGPELRIATPHEPGAYELRYVTPGKRITLGKRPITITPRSAPGTLRVVGERARPALGGATVAVILDASGSMLQRLGSERRIDIAKAAVTELVTDVLPDSVSLALRVFGHKEADSCRSDLEIPAGPLDRRGAAATVASIQAMNLARTPIAESLRRTAAEIATRPGPQLLLLVTDGEETCDGDPAAVIRELSASGRDVRVNIVGFAIDELMLQETFAEWARLGRGKYFNAGDGAQLAASLRESIEVPYSVIDRSAAIVATGTVNGSPVVVDAGTYRVVIAGNPPHTIDAVVVAMEDETTLTVP